MRPENQFTRRIETARDNDLTVTVCFYFKVFGFTFFRFHFFSPFFFVLASLFQISFLRGDHQGDDNSLPKTFDTSQATELPRPAAELLFAAADAERPCPSKQDPLAQAPSGASRSPAGSS